MAASRRTDLRAMLTLSALGARLLLVGLFLPFSALDKVLNFGAAVDQAATAALSRGVAMAMIFAGLGVEVIMSAAVLTGVADRLAGVVLAAYCVTTALLWKRFWAVPDFRLKGTSRGREIFWDFLKNLSVAGGFLLLAVGPDGSGVGALLAHPLSSTHPYAAVQMESSHAR
jgi:putative oxidoreductase